MKKILKKMLLIILVAVMILGPASLGESMNLDLFGIRVNAASGTCGDNLTWTYNESTGELVISGTGDMKNYTSYSRYTIKSVKIGKGVTSICNYAFNYCGSLTSVTIPDTVTSIGDYAFRSCDSLTNITIPNSVKTIGYEAFRDCRALTSIVIPDSVTSIGDYAFYWCDSLKSVKIGNGVKHIGSYAFYWCDALSDLTIGNSVTTISDHAFYFCDMLKSVRIPAGVTSIGEYAFHGCDSFQNITVDPANTAYSSDECGVLFNKDKTELIQYPAGNSRTKYVIPDSVTSISNYAFNTCEFLVNVTIPDGVVSIGDDAFYWCNSLINIAIPKSVTYIGEDALYCSALRSITVDPANTAYSSDEYGVLFNKDKTELIRCPEGILITKYIIPDSVTAISNSAFWYCSTLTSIAIPASVTSIGRGAFGGCYNLESIAFPDGITIIRRATLIGCSRLKSVSIPVSITAIDEYVFDDCEDLANIYYGGNQSEWKNIFVNINNKYFSKATVRYGHSHAISTVEKTIAATCEEIGYKTGTCVCGYRLTDELPVLGHNIIIDKGVVATCIATGLTEGQHCSRCDDATVDQKIIPVLGHNIVIDKAYDATCTETGRTKGQHCSRCDAMTVEQEIIPKLGHDIIIDKAVKSTCTKTGLAEGQHCSRCDAMTVEQAVVPELGHNIIIDKAVKATCTEPGLAEGQHCSRCDDATVKQEIIPVEPHNYNNTKYDSANHWKECVCGSVIEKQNHSFVGKNICECGFERRVNATIAIKNNSGSKTINYGETLKLTAVVTNMPSNAKIYWFVNGTKAGEGEFFNVNFDGGMRFVSVKLVDENGVVYQNLNGEEISDDETVVVNDGLFQKIASFFKNLFGINRIVVQAFKDIF